MKYDYKISLVNWIVNVKKLYEPMTDAVKKAYEKLTKTCTATPIKKIKHFQT